MSPAAPLPQGIECTTERGIISVSLAAAGASGPLPAAWAQLLPNLTRLDLSDNNFTGPLPEEWSALGSLSILGLRGSLKAVPEGGWSLPASWGAMTNLSDLDLSHNGLKGVLPEEWSGMKVWRRVFWEGMSLLSSHGRRRWVEAMRAEFQWM